MPIPPKYNPIARTIFQLNNHINMELQAAQIKAIQAWVLDLGQAADDETDNLQREIIHAESTMLQHLLQYINSLEKVNHLKQKARTQLHYLPA